MEEIWFLKGVDWLAELGPAEWQELRARATRRDFAPGATVFTPNAHPSSVYVLESGSIRIYRLAPTGDEVALGYVAEGEIFGELASFGDYPRESFAEAASQSAVWRIPAELFQRFLQARSGLVIAVTRQIGDRMKRVEARVESLVFRSVRSRLALVLLELAADFGREEDEGWVLESVPTQRELATLVGATRQSVNAALAQLRKDGLVERQGRGLALPAPDALRALGRSVDP